MAEIDDSWRAANETQTATGLARQDDVSAPLHLYRCATCSFLIQEIGAESKSSIEGTKEDLILFASDPMANETVKVSPRREDMRRRSAFWWCLSCYLH